MRVELLSGGGIHNPKEQYLTSFLVDRSLAIDGGSLPLALTRDQQLDIHSLIITHAHLDHFAGLPIMLDNIFADMPQTLKVFATTETIHSLHKHIFNNTIWPDFSSFKNSYGVQLEFEVIQPYKPLILNGLAITPIPVTHTIPTIGLILEDNDTAIVISGDTSDTDELWQVASQNKKLRAAFIECSYPNRLEDLANRYGHLSPKTLLAQKQKIGHEIPVYAYHVKPAYMHEVVAEIGELTGQNIVLAEPHHYYEF